MTPAEAHGLLEHGEIGFSTIVVLVVIGALLSILFYIIRGFLQELRENRKEREILCAAHQKLQIESVTAITKVGSAIDQVKDGMGEMVKYIRSKNGG